MQWLVLHVLFACWISLIKEFQAKKIRELEQGFQKDLDEVKVEFDEERCANEHGHSQQYPFINMSTHI